MRTTVGVVSWFFFFFISTMGTERAQSTTESLAQSMVSGVSGPMAQVARDYAWRPVRADVLPQAQGIGVGDQMPVRIVLLDGSGKMTNALEKTALILEATSPSGKTLSENLEVVPGASSVDLVLQATEPGMTKLIVRQPQDQILESSNFVMVTPLQPSTAGRQLLFRVSGERESSVRAGRLSHERVGVYLQDSQPARNPIEVWLTWTAGELEPNPLIIRKGERFAEAQWTSEWPTRLARVAIAEVKPAIPVSGARAATINFAAPISGVAFLNPPATVSVAGDYRLRARFYDLAGNFVMTSDKREVRVSSRNPIVRFKPQTQSTNGEFETHLLPTGPGIAEIEVATPGFPPFRHTVVVTYLEVLGMCSAGGLFAGLADLLTSQRRARGWRLTLQLAVGILAALVVCWVYVVMGLPNAPSGILHSQIAVLGVSLVGGWIGIVVLRRAVGLKI